MAGREKQTLTMSTLTWWWWWWSRTTLVSLPPLELWSNQLMASSSGVRFGGVTIPTHPMQMGPNHLVMWRKSSLTVCQRPATRHQSDECPSHVTSCLRIASGINSKQRHVDQWGAATVQESSSGGRLAGEREAIMQTRRASTQHGAPTCELTSPVGGRCSRTDSGASGRKGVAWSAPIEPRVEAAAAEA